jgi:hypothetical protein
LNRFTGEHPPPVKNIAKRTRFWSRLDRTVKDVIDNARHIAFIQPSSLPLTLMRKNRGLLVASRGTSNEAFNEEAFTAYFFLI